MELLKRIKVPISTAIKAVNTRKVDFSSGMFKGIYDKNPDAMSKFFLAIGYTSTSATKYEFQRPPALVEG